MIAALFIISSGLLTLLIAANKKDQKHICKKIIVTIKGNGSTYAIDKTDIIKLLQTSATQILIGTPISNIDPARLEAKLKTDQWIGSADIYFDSQDALHVLVTEKDPMVRIFTTSGNSFYLDSAGRKMPLLDKVSVRLPVFTNYPDVRVLKAKDSALLNDVKRLAVFINNNAFWSAQIAQVDITADNKFEAIPTIGNHVIRIGSAEDIEAKFNKLFVFYQRVLRQTGFDKYSVLDIQFSNQVVATHKGAVTAIDAQQLQKNIQELLKKNNLQTQKEDDDSDNIKPAAKTDSTTVQKATPANNIKTNITNAKPKTKTQAIPERKPKAVMPKKNAD